jgi:NAD(P)-dependent dehydrogenase (short-subunit alcohol dehydrogenase family)
VSLTRTLASARDCPMRTSPATTVARHRTLQAAVRCSTCASTVPLRRTGRPEEVRGIVMFLLSDESNYVDGAEILVDGGVIAR